MKAPLAFDPAAVDRGPASAAVRAILELHAASEWLAPPGAPAEDARAHATHHVSLVRALAPDAYAADVGVTFARGSWSAFEALARRVRGAEQPIDWKFGLLKPMSKAHSTARGWSPGAHIERHPADATEPHGLYARAGDMVFRSATWIRRCETAGLVPAAREAADWYWAFATGDLMDAIEWQLADATNVLDRNPFVPLLRLYAGGYYPFLLDRGALTLFCFDVVSVDS